MAESPAVWGVQLLRDVLHDLGDDELAKAFALLSEADRDRAARAILTGRAVAVATEMVRLGAGSRLPAGEGPTLLEVEAITDIPESDVNDA